MLSIPRNVSTAGTTTQKYSDSGYANPPSANMSHQGGLSAAVFFEGGGTHGGFVGLLHYG